MKKIEVSTSKLADSPSTMIRKAVSSDTYQLLLALWDELPMIVVTHEKLISYIGPDIRFPSQNKTVFEVIITRSITSDLELFKKFFHYDSMLTKVPIFSPIKTLLILFFSRTLKIIIGSLLSIHNETDVESITLRPFFKISR